MQVMFVLSCFIGSILTLELKYNNKNGNEIFYNSTTTIPILGSMTDIESIETISVLSLVRHTNVSLLKASLSPLRYDVHSIDKISISRSYIRIHTDYLSQESDDLFVEFTFSRLLGYSQTKDFRESYKIEKFDLFRPLSMVCDKIIIIKVNAEKLINCTLIGMRYDQHEHYLKLARISSRNLDVSILYQNDTAKINKLQIKLFFYSKTTVQNTYLELVSVSTNRIIISSEIKIVPESDVTSQISLKMSRKINSENNIVQLCATCILSMSFQNYMFTLIQNENAYPMIYNSSRNVAEQCISTFKHNNKSWSCQMTSLKTRKVYKSSGVPIPTFEAVPVNVQLYIIPHDDKKDMTSAKNEEQITLKCLSASFSKLYHLELVNQDTNYTFLSLTEEVTLSGTKNILEGNWICRVSNEFGFSESESIYYKAKNQYDSDSYSSKQDIYFYLGVGILSLLCIILVTIIVTRLVMTVFPNKIRLRNYLHTKVYHRDSGANHGRPSLTKRVTLRKKDELFHILEAHSVYSLLPIKLVQEQSKVLIDMINKLKKERTDITTQLISVLGLIARLHPGLVEKSSRKTDCEQVTDYFRTNNLAQKTTLIFDIIVTKLDQYLLCGSDLINNQVIDPTLMLILDYRIKNIRLFTYFYEVVKVASRNANQFSYYKIVKTRSANEHELVDHVEIVVLSTENDVEDFKKVEASYLSKVENTSCVIITATAINVIADEESVDKKTQIDDLLSSKPDRIVIGKDVIPSGDPTAAVFSLIKKEYIRTVDSIVVENVSAVLPYGTIEAINSTLYIEEIKPEYYQIPGSSTTSILTEDIDPYGLNESITYIKFQASLDEE